jgi:hypothetical protein
VKWYIDFNSKSKSFLHENGYVKAKELFNLNTALIQTARDKAIGNIERRKVNQQLHIIATKIVQYTKQYSKPVIVMENLNVVQKT